MIAILNIVDYIPGAMQINPEKSTAIVFPPKLNSQETELNLIYNTSNISVCEFSKYLGVTIDHRLNFKPHILSLKTRVSRSVGILSKLRSTFPSPTLLLLYHALVQPHLAYGLPLWGSTFKTYLSKLQILQNKALQIITKSDWRTPITPKFRNLKILKIADLYTFELAKLMHQCYNNSLTLFSPLLAIHERSTRSKTNNNLYLPKFSTCRCQQSIKYQGACPQNSLKFGIH